MTDWDNVLGKLPESDRAQIKQEMERRVQQDNEYMESIVRRSAEAELSRLYALMLDNLQAEQGGVGTKRPSKSRDVEQGTFSPRHDKLLKRIIDNEDTEAVLRH